MVKDLDPSKRSLHWHHYMLTTYLSNRRGHFQRALEEAVQTHTSQWPAVWGGKNPLHGGGNFSKMDAAARVCRSRSFTSRRYALTDLLKAHTPEVSRLMVPQFFRSNTKQS